MSWLKRERAGIKTRQRSPRPEVPEGLWTKCEGCGEALFQTVLEENLWTCPNCGLPLPRAGAHLPADPD